MPIPAAGSLWESGRYHMDTLRQSHDQLRGALLAAKRHIEALPKTPPRVKLLELIKTTLADARKVRKNES